MDYYFKFIKKYPTIELLANSSEKSILNLLQGLGYYSRARNLHFASKQIVQNYSCKLPNEYKELIKIKGIGKYTAAAILSIAYNKPFPVVDGNVIRVLSRLYGYKNPFKHILSHQIIITFFITIETDKEFKIEKQGFIEITNEKIENYPFPKLIENFLKNRIC